MRKKIGTSDNKLWKELLEKSDENWHKSIEWISFNSVIHHTLFDINESIQTCSTNMACNRF